MSLNVKQRFVEFFQKKVGKFLNTQQGIVTDLIFAEPRFVEFASTPKSGKSTYFKTLEEFFAAEDLEREKESKKAAKEADVKKEVEAHKAETKSSEKPIVPPSPPTGAVVASSTAKEELPKKSI